MFRGPAGRLVQWAARSPDRAAAALFALATYVPMLLTSPGRVSADTKTYLTVDPAGVLSSAATMWDPSVGAGTVPHQNIGYLFPLGPYYWTMERVGVPDWIAQRLLWATMVFAAAYGAYRLARWLGWAGAPAFVAGCAYGFSPYLLSYLARLSVILAPWAALPWMILLVARAARTTSWRPAAWFAVVVALVGSVNATALVFAGLGPVLWLLADAASGRVTARAAIAAAGRVGALSVAVSLWWIAGLRVQGTYGIPILRYTETYEAVASASTPAEIVRGLGYWFFYGGDRLDTWVGPSVPYTDHAALMALGFVLAGISLLGLLTRFPGRAAMAVLLLVGLTVSVGAAPLGDSSLYGTLFERFATHTTVGSALRSTPRAAPLVVLALAFGLGAAAARARRWIGHATLGGERPRAALLVPGTLAVLVAVQLFPWFTGRALTPSLLRDESLPAYTVELAEWLDRTGDGRVYALPGTDFANYRWGGTVDPVLPGLVDRSVLYRELVPQGGAGTANLLNAVERRLSEGWFEPESLEPVSRLLDVETVVVRNDLEHERYRLARPGPLWTDLTDTLGPPDHAGPLTRDETEIPLIDELTLAHPEAAEQFPVVAAFDLAPATEISVQPSARPTIVVGDGDGLVDIAGAGLLETDRPVLYAATLDELDGADALTGTDPWWVVTDTNRKQGRHWSTIGANLGALETAGDLHLDPDPGDQQLDLFDDELDAQTVAVHTADVADVRASYSGNRIAYTPEDAPWFAVDGDPRTAWRAGVFDETAGLVWEVDLRAPSDAGELTILQPVTGATNRWITRIRLTAGDAAADVDLDDRSRRLPGQVVAIPGDGPFTSLRIEVLADNIGPISTYAGLPGVGLAEVVIPGVDDDRVVRLPHTPDVAADERLTYVLTRQRIDPATPNRAAPEPALVRQFDVPTDRSFELGGEVRLSASADDGVLQGVLGETPSVLADRRLPGSVAARGAAAVDGDPNTAWITPFDDVEGATLSIVHPEPIDATGMTVSWRDDDRHSAPSSITLTGDAAPVRFDLGGAVSTGGIATVEVPLDGYTAATSVITIDAVTPRTSPEYFSGVPQVLPVAITELRIGDAAPVTRPAELDTGCRSDLVLLDGAPLPVRVTGDTAAALGGAELSLEACAGAVALSAGTHRLVAAGGAETGLDIDRIVLDTGAIAATSTTAPPPAVDHVDTGATAHILRVGPADEPVWITLNQSWNAGWTARVDGVDLGEPVLIDGYANGWLLAPGAAERTVELHWTPQRTVDRALLASLLGAAVVLGVLAWTWRRKDRETPSADRPGAHPLPWPVAAGLVAALAVAAGPIPAAAGALALAAGRHRVRFAAAVVVVAGGIAAAGIVALEWRRDYPVGPDWPSRFGWTAQFVWAAVAVVAAIALTPSGLRLPGGRRSDPRSDDGTDSGATPGDG